MSRSMGGRGRAGPSSNFVPACPHPWFGAQGPAACLEEARGARPCHSRPRPPRRAVAQRPISRLSFAFGSGP
eukprot:5914930-Pyramimonas_sp.AAC.1